jgi:hypothetical protein
MDKFLSRKFGTFSPVPQGEPAWAYRTYTDSEQRELAPDERQAANPS